MKERLDSILGQRVTPRFIIGRKVIPINTDTLRYSDDDGYFLANAHLTIPLDAVMNVDSHKYGNILYLNGKLMKKKGLIRLRFDLVRGFY